MIDLFSKGFTESTTFSCISKLYFSNFDGAYDLSVIGYIIPGLIASWMDRQGVLKTISVIIITSSIVKLI